MNPQDPYGPPSPPQQPPLPASPFRTADPYGQPQAPSPHWAPTPPPSAYGYAPPPPQGGVSRFGVAGIILALLSLLGYFSMIIVAAATVDPKMDPQVAATQPGMMMIGALILGAIALNFLAALVSAFGFAETSRSKTTVWFGLVLSIVPLLLCSGMMVLSLFAAVAG